MRRRLALFCCALALFHGNGTIAVLAQEAPPAAEEGAEAEAPPISPEELDALVAPIALYPDPLLAQTLVASTYPLELIQLQQWLLKNPDLKDQELSDAVAKEPWDPSIQSMAAFPDVVKRLSDDIQWTTDLGNAFLAQQSDVMDAVQRMRQKAQEKGTLESNDKQEVTTQTIENKTVVVVQPTNPDVIYVPSYSPVVVYGPPVVYAYPPIYYPPDPFVTFAFGVAVGAAFWGGSCCGCGWGSNDVDIDVNNNFNRNTNIDRGDGGGRGEGGRGEGGKWKHDPQHRGGTPYGDKATANKFGGNARGDSLSSRQTKARQQGSAGNRPSTSNRAAGTGRAGTGGAARPSTNQARPGGGGAGGRAPGGDQVGNRNIGKSAGAQGGLGGGSGGYNGASARASSNRGASSMGSRGGGRGGGGRGGGRRR